MPSKYGCFIFCMILVFSTSNAFSQEQSTDDLAKQAQNPIANLISLPLQNNTNFDIGPNDDEVQKSTQVGYFIFERQVWENLTLNCRDFVYRLLCKNDGGTKRIISAEEALCHPWMRDV